MKLLSALKDKGGEPFKKEWGGKGGMMSMVKGLR